MRTMSCQHFECGLPEHALNPTLDRRDDSWDDSDEEDKPKPARAGVKRKASAPLNPTCQQQQYPPLLLCREQTPPATHTNLVGCAGTQ